MPQQIAVKRKLKLEFQEDRGYAITTETEYKLAAIMYSWIIKSFPTYIKYIVAIPNSATITAGPTGFKFQIQRKGAMK
jgi:hypothetical protein